MLRPHIHIADKIEFFHIGGDYGRIVVEIYRRIYLFRKSLFVNESRRVGLAEETYYLIDVIASLWIQVAIFQVDVDGCFPIFPFQIWASVHFEKTEAMSIYFLRLGSSNFVEEVSLSKVCISHINAVSFGAASKG